jgi:hypothetical protein
MLRPKEGAKAGGLADQSFEHVVRVLRSIEEASLV